MSDVERLVGAIAAALRDEVPGLDPSVAQRAARVAARVSTQNLTLVIGSMPEDLMPQTRPDLSVVPESGSG